MPTPAAASADCSRLLSGLPGEIRTDTGMLPRRILADPVPAATVAWGGEDGATPIVLRCGLPRPPEGATGPLRDVVGVDWVAVADDTPGSTTWVTVDRAVHIGLTVPDGFGRGPAARRLARGQDRAGEPLTAPQRGPAPRASAVSTRVSSSVG